MNVVYGLLLFYKPYVKPILFRIAVSIELKRMSIDISSFLNAYCIAISHPELATVAILGFHILKDVPARMRIEP